jgi:hypothetical protein
MKNVNKLLASGLFAQAIVLVTSVRAADNASSGGFGADVGQPSNVPTDLETAIMDITNWILGFITLVAVLIVIYGGLLYLTAAGNDDQTAKGRKTITNGIIGLVICALAYSLVRVVASGILNSNG